MSAIAIYVNDSLFNRKQLWSGPNCVLPDNAAYALGMRMHDIFNKNKSPGSFRNFIEFYHKLKKAPDSQHTGIRNENTIQFDKNALQNEVKEAMKEALELPGMKESGCYTGRTDVVELVEKFYNDLLSFAVTLTRTESAPASAPASASEGGKKKKGGNKSAKKQTKNLCHKKSTQKKSTKKSTKGKSKCESVKGCKVASGSKRTYCRKAHNKTHKKK